MPTIDDYLRALECEQERRTTLTKDRGDRFARFYRSRRWIATRLKFLSGLKPEQRRCAACGATARNERLVVDHVIPIKSEEGWRRRFTGPFQILCNPDNLAKASQQMDFRQTAETISDV